MNDKHFRQAKQQTNQEKNRALEQDSAPRVTVNQLLIFFILKYV